MPHAQMFTVVQVFTFDNFQYSLTFNINKPLNSPRLLGISTPENFSSIIKFSPIHINLGILNRKGVNIFLLFLRPGLSKMWPTVLQIAKPFLTKHSVVRACLVFGHYEE